MCKFNILEAFAIILHGLCWLFVTKVLGQTISPILKSQAVQFFFDHFTVEDGTNSFTWNVGNQLPACVI